MIRYGSAILVLLFGGTCVSAQPVPAEEEVLSRIGLPGESQRTARRLMAADKLVAEQKWAEAVEDYQRILTEAGDDLVRLNARHSLQARRLCHSRLAALPAAALRFYRARVDGQAKKWFDQAAGSRDAGLLRRLVDELFCSRFTDQALDLLGDLAFERGEFEEAEQWWRMLALPASLKDKGSRIKDELLFPDPQVDEARVRAKQLLARLFRGERTGLQQEWQAFQALHGQATGYLAGKKGNYAAILQELADQAEVSDTAAVRETWPTFAGDASRGYILPRVRGRLAPPLPHIEEPTWVVPLEAAGKAVPPSQAARALAFYPLIVGDQVLVADARHVMAYELSSGREVLYYPSEPGKDRKLPAELDHSYTLTATDERVYARLGAQSLDQLRRGDDNSFLVCLNWPKTGSAKIEPWRVEPQTVDGSQAVFEGTPLVHNGRVYLAVTRQAGIQVRTAIACYDADKGTLRWQREICETQELKDSERRARNHLLTLAGAQIVFASHSGAIVALDAATGRRTWAVRYPSRGPRTIDRTPSPRSLAPCLYAGGRVYAAPADFDRILCLDAATGHQLWESTPLEVIHLLGVAKGRLIFTTTTPRRCIRALDAATGNPLRTWLQPADGTPLVTFGRGLLAGDYVFWPTRIKHGSGPAGDQDRLYVLNQADGEVIDWLDNVGGNLAAANGCLVVASATRLSAYVPEAQLLPRRRKEAAENTGSAAARFRLALAEASAGLEDQALEELLRVEALAGPTEHWHKLPLTEAARRRRFEVLLEAAQRARQAKHWQDAASYLERAAANEFPSPARLQAMARRASLWAEAGQPDLAIQAWQAILDEPSLSQGHLLDCGGLPQPAAAFAAGRIRELVLAHGPRVYDAVEQRARALWTTAQGEKRKEVLDRLGREFPNATVTGPALLELAQLELRAGKAGAAAQAYRLLRRGKSEPARPVALAGLARAYESQHCWPAAYFLWQQLVTEQGDHIVTALDPDHPVRDFVAQQLQRREYSGTKAVLPPGPPLPLSRAWSSVDVHRDLSAAEEIHLPEGGPWIMSANEYLFLVRGTTLIGRELFSGKRCWQRTLPATPSWIGCHADLVLVAAGESIYSFRQVDGEPVWSWSMVADYGLKTSDDARSTLGSFQLTESRLLFLQDERRLFALDVESGQTLWDCWAPAAMLDLPYPVGRFQLRYGAGEQGVVLQTTTGKLIVLDSQTGRRRLEDLTSPEPWRQPPLALDDRRFCLVRDPEHILLLDSATGQQLWTHAIERPVSLSGETPQVMGNGEVLLVLVFRNYGCLLECLDSRTGKRRWPRARFLGSRSVNLEAGALDERAVYLLHGSSLQAYGLADGKLLWQRPLPGPELPWRAVRTGNHVAVFPSTREAIRMQVRWLSWTGTALISSFPATQPGGYFPLLFCDPKTGQLVQRLNFPPPAPELQLRGDSDLALAWFPQLHRHRFRVRGGQLPVQFSDRGLAVVLGGNAWMLTANAAP